MRRSKRYVQQAEKARAEEALPLDDAISKVKETASAKFDETVEVAFRLGIDPRKSDQQLRGTVVLPHGTGRSVKILVLAKGEKVKEAEEAGADFVGSDEYIEKIQGGWLEPDTIIATPDMMKDVGKLGKILGPRGLMPNPKSGTVTFDIGKAVEEAKAGKIEYRTDKTANLHAVFGKASFEEPQLRGNLVELAREILKARPAAAKGQYVRNVTISTTMGPGIDVNVPSLVDATKLKI
ncbi:MAG: 50S ribosomal protein L1 [Candidatus Eisenbacteria bacterium]|nr:50S ribosomal protein L1 [Candidatus Eisenbacteria bacterium]